MTPESKVVPRALVVGATVGRSGRRQNAFDHVPFESAFAHFAGEQIETFVQEYPSGAAEESENH
jgi:hypothetical protein